ncbi:MAG TPA: helix-turn-helix transcriptional regulator [Anaeromyxobacteraceae bacterium]|nr:helix-turn-helix transcriptional regulator [Anaeromyxobacteraceae bacterium]
MLARSSRALPQPAQLDAVHGEALESTATAVREMRKRLGLSVRDIADLLGISHQRVQQLAREPQCRLRRH